MSTLSELRSSYGKGEAELQRLIIPLLAVGDSVKFSGRDTYVRIWGRFTSKSRAPVYRFPDVLIDSCVFGSGVFLVKGDVHSTRSHARKGGKDDQAREDYESQHLWVEEPTPSEARDLLWVKAALERHRIVWDEYGGTTSQ